MEEEIGVRENEDSEERAEEKANGLKEEEERAEKSKQERGSKKRGKGRSPREKMNNKKKEVEEKKKKKKDKEQKTPMGSAIERPVRERKSVERLVASIEKEVVKDFHIEKGRGTALKDIPNVAYKLSRRKMDDTFKLLHAILFGRRGKIPLSERLFDNVMSLACNSVTVNEHFRLRIIFPGFLASVWNDNEEKQKIKVKEKLDKCVKEKLLEFCDVLDLPIVKATTRKEDIVVKLMEFLVAPHATTTELLAEKEQSSKGKKRKRVVKQSASMSGGTPSKHSAKSRRRNENTSKAEDKKNTPETEDELEEEEEHEEEKNVNGVPKRSKDEMPDHSESEEKEIESGDEPEEDMGKKKREHKKREEVVKEKPSTPKKSTTKEKTGKKIMKRKDKPKEDKLRPSDDELRNAICEILKEVDFNTATFTDILKQLAGKFNTDLAPRKSSIKLMIQDELTKLADEADDEEDEGDAEKEEDQPSGQGVEA
ncbi:hypothetical protein F0562_008709 [Nyssa sinensis]|uniref:DEK-C domain-containing protein n=1 Tax=Nyssa sinensis TaxID=561372 RepID=A0A5J5AAZ3_9ASTE|nr:hypothetical protein F0562_008709 [Nyssa sinensis]